MFNIRTFLIFGTAFDSERLYSLFVTCHCAIFQSFQTFFQSIVLYSLFFCGPCLLKTTTTFLSVHTEYMITQYTVSVLLCILGALVPRVSKLLCICILHTASLTIFHSLPFPVIFFAALNCVR